MNDASRTRSKLVPVGLVMVAVIWAASAWAGCGEEPEGAPVAGVSIVRTFERDPDFFTQGLAIHEGMLYQGSGQRGKSKIQKIDLATGKTLESKDLAPSLFGEGICIHGDAIYQLTWKKGTCLVWRLDRLRRIGKKSYEGEGWGLTSDGTRLIMSDGSSKLTFRDPETFEVIDSVTVTEGGEEIRELNELEYIEGEIWANVWQRRLIARIDPKTGEVKSWVDLEGLREKVENENPGWENGIAYDAAKREIWVTGKSWDRMFQITVE